MSIDHCIQRGRSVSEDWEKYDGEIHCETQKLDFLIDRLKIGTWRLGKEGCKPK